MFMLLSGGGSADVSSLADILSAGTQVVTWLITQMGAFLAFITSHPIIFIYMLIFLAGTGIAFLMRIWHSM